MGLLTPSRVGRKGHAPSGACNTVHTPPFGPVDEICTGCGHTLGWCRSAPAAPCPALRLRVPPTQGALAGPLPEARPWGLCCPWMRTQDLTDGAVPGILPPGLGPTPTAQDPPPPPKHTGGNSFPAQCSAGPGQGGTTPCLPPLMPFGLENVQLGLKFTSLQSAHPAPATALHQPLEKKSSPLSGKFRPKTLAISFNCHSSLDTYYQVHFPDG